MRSVPLSPGSFGRSVSIFQRSRWPNSFKPTMRRSRWLPMDVWPVLPRRAVIEAREKGMKVGLLKLVTLWPFVRSAVEKILQTSKILLVPEMNMGQISREVKRVNRGMAKVFTLNKVDGTIITPEEILNRITGGYA